MSNIIATIQSLIAQDKIEKAIQATATLTQNTENEQVTILISQDFRSLQLNALKGLITDEEERTQKTKIAKRILDLLNELKPLQNPIGMDTMSNTPLTDFLNLKKHGWKYITGLGVIIGIFGGCSETLNFMKGCGSGNCGELSNLTVYVQSETGDLVLKQQGHIWLDSEGGERKKVMIDDKGIAAFQNVKTCDKIRIGVDFSEPYRPVKMDSIYTVPTNGRIYLTVGLQNLGRVFGSVIYREQPIEGVLIDVNGLRDTTDLTGRFEIFIPKNQQRQDPEVKFLKKGFKMMVKKAYPQTNEPLNVVMEK